MSQENNIENQENYSFLQRSIRKTCSDLWFNQTNIENQDYTHILFTRLVASKNTKFTNVNFSYCIFDHAYLRECSFDNCLFLGCKFLNSNFNGSSFIKCDFRYCFFDKTFIDEDFLDNMPEEKNLKQRLLRTIRINYQQLGDSKNVNKVMLLELQATRDYLKDAAFSDEKYYQKKYGGFKKRTKAIINLICFIFWDFIWGNGEKLSNLIRLFIFVLIGIVIYDMYHASPQDSDSLSYLINSIFRSVAIFFSVENPDNFSDSFKTLIVFIRLFLFALFISILVKRLNRR